MVPKATACPGWQTEAAEPVPCEKMPWNTAATWLPTGRGSRARPALRIGEGSLVSSGWAPLHLQQMLALATVRGEWLSAAGQRHAAFMSLGHCQHAPSCMQVMPSFLLAQGLP